MAKQTGPVKLEGTIGNICFYEMDGEWYARLKSSLTGKRVKKDPRFRRTMEYAGMLTQASRLASGGYQRLPKAERAYPMYRAMVGMAMQLLKMGWDAEEISVELEKGFVVVPDVAVAPAVMEEDVVFPDVVVATAAEEDDMVMTDVAVAAAVVVDDTMMTDVVVAAAVIVDDTVKPNVIMAPTLPGLYVNNTGQLVSREFHNDRSPSIQKYFTPPNRIPMVLRC